MVANKIPDLRAKIESILFCVPAGADAEALAKKVNASQNDVKAALLELQKDYENRQGLKIVFDSGIWKFKIPEEYISVIKDVAEPEFDKSILETLAYIAWRGGSRQCDVVRVRSNKAYNHIKFLVERGFVESHKSGLSKWLQPTKKFYEYFSLKHGEKLPVESKKAVDVSKDIENAMNMLFG